MLIIFLQTTKKTGAIKAHLNIHLELTSPVKSYPWALVSVRWQAKGRGATAEQQGVKGSGRTRDSPR